MEPKMTERTDILYIKKTVKRLFNQKWQLFKTSTSSSNDPVPTHDFEELSAG